MCVCMRIRVYARVWACQKSYIKLLCGNRESLGMRLHSTCIIAQLYIAKMQKCGIAYKPDVHVHV